MLRGGAPSDSHIYHNLNQPPNTNTKQANKQNKTNQTRTNQTERYHFLLQRCGLHAHYPRVAERHMMHLTVGVTLGTQRKRLGDLMRRTPFKSVRGDTVTTGPFRNWVKTAFAEAKRFLQMGAVWGKDCIGTADFESSDEK